MGQVWISEIIPIPPSEHGEGTEAHMARVHGVSLLECEQACLFYNPERAKWRDDPVRGRRLIVWGRTVGGRMLRVILRPTAYPETFVLINAWEVPT